MIYQVKNHSWVKDKKRLLEYEISYTRESQNEYTATAESASEEVIYDMLFQITEHEGLPVLVLTNGD